MKFDTFVVKDIVRIVFHDHYDRKGDGDAGPLIFEAFGRVIGITDETIEITHWTNPYGASDDNTEIHGISRGSMICLEVLK